MEEGAQEEEGVQGEEEEEGQEEEKEGLLFERLSGRQLGLVFYEPFFWAGLLLSAWNRAG